MARKTRRQTGGGRGSTALAPQSGHPQTLLRAASRAKPGKTKVLLVRQPVRSARSVDQYDRSGLRLATGVIVAVGVVAAIWGLGMLGFHLGYAEIMRVPGLALDAGEALAGGILMLLSVPRLVLETGIARPVWLMAGFALIALPAAGLSAARPRVPGGPRPPAIVVAFAALGAAAAGLNGALLVWWHASPERSALLRTLPFELGAVEAWAGDLAIAAGLDVLAVLAGALWMVLAWRLPNPTWLRTIVVSVSVFALALAAAGLARSSGAATGIHRSRALCVRADEGTVRGQLLLGDTRHHQALLELEAGRVSLVELSAADATLSVVGTQSVVEYLGE